MLAFFAKMPPYQLTEFAYRIPPIAMRAVLEGKLLSFIGFRLLGSLCFPPLSQCDHLIGHHLGAIMFVSGLVLPSTGLQAALDVNLLPLA